MKIGGWINKDKEGRRSKEGGDRIGKRKKSWIPWSNGRDERISRTLILGFPSYEKRLDASDGLVRRWIDFLKLAAQLSTRYRDFWANFRGPVYRYAFTIDW